MIKLPFPTSSIPSWTRARAIIRLPNEDTPTVIHDSATHGPKETKLNIKNIGTAVKDSLSAISNAAIALEFLCLCVLKCKIGGKPTS